MKWPAPAWAAAFTAAACGSQATGTGYQGQPLFTIDGQMITEGAAPNLPIRLAVAWYADHTTLGGPQAIVTQDVEYQGSFPLAYSFSFFGPPPASVLNPSTAGGATFRAGWGVLIAYEDLNGNGQLDIIPEGGSPVDQILATSIGDIFNGDPASSAVRVAYIDGQPPASLEGFTAGYNLYQGRTSALSKSTPVPLELSAATGPSELDLFVCPDFVTGAYLASPNSAAHSSFDLPCNIPPTGGVRVSGSFLLANGVPTAWIRVTDGVNPLPAADVTINGTSLTYSAFDGVFEGTGSGFASSDGGVDQLAVTYGDGGTRLFALPRPGDFAIESPDPNLGPHFLAGSPITVNWSSSTPAATTYEISLISTLAPYGADLKQEVTAASGPTQQTQIVAPAVDGPEWLNVFATNTDQPIFGEGGSVLYPETYRSAYLDLAPADTQLTASGTLVVHKGLILGSVSLVQPYDAAVPLSADNASVSVNGQPLIWSIANQEFYGFANVLDAGAVNTVEVSAPGLNPIAVQVPIPGDFSIQPPLKMIPAGALVDLTWSPSLGARGYNVLVEVSDGGTEIPLTAVTTQDAGISIVMPTQTGRAQLVVVALGAQSDRHFGGAVEETLEIQLK